MEKGTAFHVGIAFNDAEMAEPLEVRKKLLTEKLARARKIAERRIAGADRPRES